MARIALLLLVIFAGIQWLPAQESVPDGEASPAPALSELSGTVSGPSGDNLSATRVSVKSMQRSEEPATYLNVMLHGKFQMWVAPGPYRVVVEAPGFNSFSKEVSVRANQPLNLKVELTAQSAVPEGPASPPDCRNVDPGAVVKPGQVSIAPCRIGAAPVPVGDVSPNLSALVHGAAAHGGSTPRSTLPADVTIPESGAVAVSAGFSNEVDLAAWLNRQSARNLRVQAIVSPTQGYQNLFIWIAHTGVDQHFVVAAKQIGSPEELQNVLKAYPQASVIGLAWVQLNPYLVLRNNP